MFFLYLTCIRENKKKRNIQPPAPLKCVKSINKKIQVYILVVFNPLSVASERHLSKKTKQKHFKLYLQALCC